MPNPNSIYTFAYDKLVLEDEYSFISHTMAMEVRSPEEGSEFVRLVRTKISEEIRRCDKTRSFFWLEDTVPEGWLTLDQYLTRIGPFPIDNYFAASITQQVASAILFLHQSKIIYGSLSAESIVIDLDGVVHVLPPPTAWRTSMRGDIWLLGKLLLRMVTGQNEYPPPNTPVPINEPMLKLAGLMLDTPMTAGQVRYHPALVRLLSEKPSALFFNQ